MVQFHLRLCLGETLVEFDLMRFLRPRPVRRVAPVEERGTERMAGLLVILLFLLCFLNMYLVFKIWSLEDRIVAPSLSLAQQSYRPPQQR